MSDTNPPLAAVIGWPIGHSMSPVIHTYWLKKLGLNGHYIPIGLRPENFEPGVRSLPKLGFKGANITIPYKETILSMAKTVSDRAALIGAANTIVFREDGNFFADNTDGYGFMQNLRQQAPDWSAASGPAVVFGAGGAARAIVSALLEGGAPEVRVTNRTRHRAEIIKDQFGARVVIVDFAKYREALHGASTIVNTTSLGMTGQQPLNVRLEFAPRDALVTDIVYNPLKTDFLQQAEQGGMRVVDGLGMLLHQAVPGFESWFDYRPTVDDELRNLVIQTMYER